MYSETNGNSVKRIMLVASDNSLTSGAFLSMVKLASLLKKEHQLDVLVILPFHGKGEELLDTEEIPYQIIQSYPWVIRINASAIDYCKIPMKLAINIIAVRRIKRVIKKYQPGIVHINTSWTYVGTLAAKNTDANVVWHIREYLEEDQYIKIWNRRAGYNLLKESDAIVTISKDLYKKYYSKLGTDNLCTIYNGIDVKKFYRPDKHIFTSNKYYLSCVGALNKGKGQEQLIKACSILRNSGINNYELHIVGVGKCHDDLQNLITSLELEDDIFLDGYCAAPEYYYEKSDIVFMTSHCEAFGRVTIEAMLAGALVIGSNTGATPELIGNDHYGYLFKMGDAEDLAKKIIFAISHKDQSCEKAENARKRAYQVFSAERNAEEIKELYDQIVVRKKEKKNEI